jgi:hypothetical protein
MRYEGLTPDVKAIQKEIADGQYCVEIKRPKTVNLFNVKSSVVTDILVVLPPGRRDKFGIRFHYDGRNGHSTVDIRDSDFGWIWKLSPNIIKLFSKLEAQQEVKICMACGGHNVVPRDNYFWCNDCRLPTPGIRTRWVGIEELEKNDKHN